jgi:lipopolysaccharide export system protein LptC
MKILPRGGAGALLPLFVMLMLAALTMWLSRTIVLTAPESAAAPQHEPDYIVDKFTLTRLSDTGIARYRLAAERMVHFADDDSSHLTLPRLTQLQPGKPDTRVRADRGVIDSGGDIAHLYDNVEMFQAGTRGKGTASSGSDDMRITTSYLRVRADADRADTPAPVRIEQGSSVLTGTGMDYDNRYRRFQLASRVTASFRQGGVDPKAN